MVAFIKKSSRLAVCAALVAALLTTALFPMPAGAAADNSLSIFVAADIHYRPLSTLVPLGDADYLPGDELYSHVNTKGMLTYEADAVIDEFLDRFEASDSRYLLIPGDLSEDGFWEEHLGIAQKLKDCEARSGKKIFVIPGNHDIRTSDSRNRLDLSDFLDVYAEIGYDDALALHEGTASYTAELDGGYRLLAIDACIYRQDGSFVSPELLEWIEAQVSAARRDGKKLIGMVHHSLLEHFGIQSVGADLLCLDNYRELATRFADWGVKYFLTGHGHTNDIACAVSKNGNKIFDIETASLITYPNAYREIDFSDTAVKIETKYIDKIDISLLPEGYSARQLELLENDFPTYSYNYFRAGFKSYAYLIPGLTAELAGKLKIEEGSQAYAAVDEIMQILCAAASLPLYDTAGTPEADSIEEIAEKQGFTIDRSDYDSVLDVAAVIYAAHYAGDESLDYDSPEIRLFSHGLNSVLLYALTEIPVAMANALFTAVGLPSLNFSIIDTFDTALKRGRYIKTAANLIVKELLEPITDGIINDISVPGDNNETLEPYSSTLPLEGPSIKISELDNLLNILFKLFKAIFNAIAAAAPPFPVLWR